MASWQQRAEAHGKLQGGHCFILVLRKTFLWSYLGLLVQCEEMVDASGVWERVTLCFQFPL